MNAPSRGPLAGVRVVDMTTTLMGPYCGVLLAQMGASVIKVERPGGDVARYIDDASGHGLGAMYMNFNRGKRSVVLDVKKSPQDLDVLMSLIAEADVFAHNLRPSAVGRLRLTYEAVSERNEALVYCSMHGFDQRGPWRDKPAYDDTVQAASGIAAMQGGLAGGAPTYIKSPIADKTVGIFAALGIMTALYERSISGRGQSVSVPMYETMATFNAMDQLGSVVFDPPRGPHGYVRMESPNRRPYSTADGYIAVLVYTDQHWRTFFELIGRPDLLDDERYGDIGARTKHIDELYQMVADFLPQRTTAEWLTLFDQADIPATPVLSINEVINSPQSLASGIFESVDHPVVGLLRQPGMPITFSRTPPEPADAAALLGADTERVRALISEADVSDAGVW
ncbi:MAG: L-carnitine dehydratase/bile acid-inducible protein [Mycobacterium sp.]|nr:L-carnitine dehydratase/bile acid-inducible protein [Mycobacterium sp.]